METPNLLNLLFGSEPWQSVVAFIIFTIFGMSLYKMARFVKKKKEGLRQIPPVDIIFRRDLWLKDNLLDYLLAFMISFAFFRFLPDAIDKFWIGQSLPKFTDKMTYGFVLGILWQVLFHKLLNNIKLEEGKIKKTN